jgi:hypothetical protein
MPVSRIEVFDGFKLQSDLAYLAIESPEFTYSPKLVSFAGGSPTGLGAGRLIAAGLPRPPEIINQVRDNMSGASLPRELEVLPRKQMSI